MPKVYVCLESSKVILNQDCETIYIDAENDMFEFPDQNPNNPINNIILLTKGSCTQVNSHE